MPEIFISKSERETEKIAFDLAKDNKIRYKDVVALYGDLGAGKTAFTRGLVNFFSPGSRVASPTFALVNEYKPKSENNKKILHFDMYRINSEEDLLSVGFFDCLGEPRENIMIIEWFDKIAGFFDENTVNINIEKLSGDNKDERKIIFERPGD